MEVCLPPLATRWVLRVLDASALERFGILHMYRSGAPATADYSAPLMLRDTGTDS